jgi:hypothetical protein
MARYPDAGPEVMYDLVRAQLDRLLSFNDALDTKLGVYFGIGSAVIGALAAVYVINPHALTPTTGGIVLVVGAGLYLQLAIICLSLMWPRKWDTEPDIDAVYARYARHSADEIKWTTTHDYAVYCKRNLTRYTAKAKRGRWAPILLLAETGVLVLAALAVALGLAL